MASYRDLIAWRRAHDNLLTIIKLVQRLPRRSAAWEIERQLIGAAGSIGANIAEGQGRQMQGRRFADCRNFFEVAYASAAETDNWLQVLRDSGWIESEAVAAIQSRNEEVMRMLFALIERQTERAAALTSFV
ncbi:MAG: four helix bundle protein [Candidatus Uhrbacteria bacterium]